MKPAAPTIKGDRRRLITRTHYMSYVIIPIIITRQLLSQNYKSKMTAT